MDFCSDQTLEHTENNVNYKQRKKGTSTRLFVNYFMKRKHNSKDTKNNV